MFKIRFILFIAGYSFSAESIAQSTSLTRRISPKYYFTWGYNRDKYTRSTIHFVDKGAGNYDFKAYHAKAHDQPDMEHILKTAPTIPQYDITLGYVFNTKKNLAIEGSWNHLKYVVTEHQTVRVKGTIHGNAIDQDTTLNWDFVHFEHTNGNNYLRLGLVQTFPILTRFLSASRLVAVTKYQGGILFPKTYSRIMKMENDGPFRPSGIVAGFNFGLRYNLARFLFLETNTDLSYAWYTGAKLYGAGRARHRFGSAQFMVSLGVGW